MIRIPYLLLLLIVPFFCSAATGTDSSALVKKGFQLAEKQYDLLFNEHKDLSLYPRSADPNGKTSFTSISDWTGGFWPGCLWYVFEYTANDKWRDAALKWTNSLRENQFNTNHHDIGFVMNCSYGNAYRLTGDTTFKAILIQSAKSLLTRFNPKVGAIKSWNSFASWDGVHNYSFPVIIDNMMNLELLFLASKLSGNPVYREVAVRHAETTLKNQYRPDFSSYHVVNYDPETGQVLSRETAQGFSDNSAWARGQAWGLYGFTVMYRETRDPKYLQAAIKMADFYSKHPRLPNDKVPLWDFDVDQPGFVPNWDYRKTDFASVPRDASAAAVTASALLELVGYVQPQQQQAYSQLAQTILESLASEHYSSKVGENGYLLLKHNVGSIPHKGEIDVPIIYADYYYLEALLRWNKLVNESEQKIMREWKAMHAKKAAACADFQKQKFGMFIHWGLYAIPGGIWNGQKIEAMGSPGVAEWIQLVAKIPRSSYENLARQFNPAAFDADEIVRLAKQAGMKYLVVTSKHHDGFAMYDSKVSAFNIVQATPLKRDVIQELYDACLRQGLDFGLYYSHNIDWKDGSDAQYALTKAHNAQLNRKTDAFGANRWDPSPNSFAAYLQEKAIPQVVELLQRYKKLKYIWFDMPGLMTPQQSFRFYKTVYDLNPEVIVSERIGNGMGDYDIPGDNRIPAANERFDKPWEAIGTFNHSWGYKSYDQDWKSIDELRYWLLEICSKGGNYMLNIGPDAQGQLAEQVKQNLSILGDWLKTNGEAIYGSKPWIVQHEGPTAIQITDTEQREKEGFKANFTASDFWFTQKQDALYALAMVAPADGKVSLRSLNQNTARVRSVEVLGGGNVVFQQDQEGLHLQLPKGMSQNTLGYALKIRIEKSI
ncbi:alpha-L-fucosidase [Sphingobacterium sp. NGMCC 1.201703]|uniref:alpha-L-fucosidase n=1 Tax=Sphingobacterium sp. NGMCC 1.201703 TaxID=3388657 RepID=UPI0039FDCB4D